MLMRGDDDVEGWGDCDLLAKGAEFMGPDWAAEKGRQLPLDDV